MNIKNTRNSYQTGKCLCGMGTACKQVRTLFQQANDIRGQVFKAPNIANTTRNKAQKEISEKWLKRTSVHWNNTSYNVLSAACNQKEKNNLPTSSRTRMSTSITKLANNQPKVPKIGLWHYHPKLIQKYTTNGNTTIPKAIPVSEMQSLGLYDVGGRAGENSFYTAADTIVDKENRQLVLTLPIYPLSDALTDAQDSKKSHDVTIEVESIRNKRKTRMLQQVQTDQNVDSSSGSDSDPSNKTIPPPSNTSLKRKWATTKAELLLENGRLKKINSRLDRELRGERLLHKAQKKENRKLIERIKW